MKVIVLKEKDKIYLVPVWLIKFYLMVFLLLMLGKSSRVAKSAFFDSFL